MIVLFFLIETRFNNTLIILNKIKLKFVNFYKLKNQ